MSLTVVPSCRSSQCSNRPCGTTEPTGSPVGESSYHDFDCLKDGWPSSGYIKLSGDVHTTEGRVQLLEVVQKAVVTGRDWNRLTAMCFWVQHEAPLPPKTHPSVAKDRCRAAALGGLPHRGDWRAYVPTKGETRIPTAQVPKPANPWQHVQER